MCFYRSIKIQLSNLYSTKVNVGYYYKPCNLADNLLLMSLNHYLWNLSIFIRYLCKCHLMFCSSFLCQKLMFHNLAMGSQCYWIHGPAVMSHLHLERFHLKKGAIGKTDLDTWNHPANLTQFMYIYRFILLISYIYLLGNICLCQK